MVRLLHTRVAPEIVDRSPGLTYHYSVEFQRRSRRPAGISRLKVPWLFPGELVDDF